MARRRNFACYAAALGDLPGLEFMPEADFGTSTRWLTCLTIDPTVAGIDREQIRLHLAEHQIETRPVWKPLHLQPTFADCAVIGGHNAERLFTQGLCLPSGSSLTDRDRDYVIETFRAIYPC